MQDVVIVSAEPMVHGLWAYLLKERGYNVTVETPQHAGGGEPASFPDLVIFDINPATPLTAGILALDGLRRRHPDVPLITLVSPNTPCEFRRLYEEQSNGCLTKPVDYGALLRLVDMLVLEHGTAFLQPKKVNSWQTLTPV